MGMMQDLRSYCMSYSRNLIKGILHLRVYIEMSYETAMRLAKKQWIKKKESK